MEVFVVKTQAIHHQKVIGSICNFYFFHHLELLLSMRKTEQQFFIINSERLLIIELFRFDQDLLPVVFKFQRSLIKWKYVATAALHEQVSFSGNLNQNILERVSIGDNKALVVLAGLEKTKLILLQQLVLYILILLFLKIFG